MLFISIEQNIKTRFSFFVKNEKEKECFLKKTTLIINITYILLTYCHHIFIFSYRNKVFTRSISFSIFQFEEK